MNNRDNSKKKTSAYLIKRAFIKSLPVMAGYLVLGTGFGMLAYSHGLGIWWPLLMSIFIYAGSLEYVAIDMIGGGVGFITIFFTSLAVNARHLLYGLSMLDKYKKAGKKKPYLIYALTDETYSLLVKDDTEKENNTAWFYFFVSLFDHLYWITGSLLGCLAGRFIPINTTGIDFSLTALFVTVAVEQWCEAKKHWPAAGGGISAIICRLIFGADSFLIPTMFAIVICLSAPDIFSRIEKKRKGSCS